MSRLSMDVIVRELTEAHDKEATLVHQHDEFGGHRCRLDPLLEPVAPFNDRQLVLFRRTVCLSLP
jgi:hypothetical protein